MLEYVPARFKVIRHVRPKLGCACCERIVQAPAPIRPIDRGLAGPGPAGARAGVRSTPITCRCTARRRSTRAQGVELDRSTLADWVGAVRRACSRRWSTALARYVLAGDKLHADDTPVPVLAAGTTARPRPGGCGPTCAMTGRPAATEPPAVWFAYSPDRKGEHPQTHLKAFPGILQADGYAGFDAAVRRRRDPGGRLLGARAAQVLRHCTRPRHRRLAGEALERIGALYAIEAEIRGKPPAEAPAGSPGACRAAAGRVPCLAARDTLRRLSAEVRTWRWRSAMR